MFIFVLFKFILFFLLKVLRSGRVRALDSGETCSKEPKCTSMGYIVVQV